MRYIELSMGQRAVIDDSDFALVNQYKWHAQKRGSELNPRWYAVHSVNPSQKLLMHNLLLGAIGVDHEDGNGLNNQRANLRLASGAQNSRNTRPWGRSGFKGVYRRPKCVVERWDAYIRHDGVQRYLGAFSTPHEAARAYDAAAKTYFGEFAWLNFRD